MLKLAILLCAIFVVTAAFGDTSVNILESSHVTDELRKVNITLLALSEAVFKETSIFQDTTSKLDEEISVQNEHINAAEQMLNELSDEPNEAVKYSECVQQNNKLKNAAKSTIHNVFNCIDEKIRLFYTSDTYNRFVGIADDCEKDNIEYSRHSSLDCYGDARKLLTAMFESTDELKWKEISPPESYTELILADCKFYNNFDGMNIQLSTMEETTKKCIFDIKEKLRQ